MAVKPKEQSIQEKQPEAGPEGAAEISAIYCDTYYINVWPDYMRLTFGEALEGKAYYRQAVAMPIGDAESLANDILTLVKEHRESLVKEHREEAEKK
jgi:hypothetical protein